MASAWSGRVEPGVAPGIRLDRYIAESLGILSRSQIKARGLAARLEGKAVKLSHILRGGERLELSWNALPELELTPENIPLSVIHEDSRVIVIDKAQGMVVHPGAGNFSGTLANALLWRRLERGGENGAGIRPGIVHRLDKDTSGVIVAAWDSEAHEFLARQFASRTVRKTYAALVTGAPPAKRGRIDSFLARDRNNRKRFAVSGQGKRAITLYRLVRAWEGFSLLLLRPKTGRTHQIRVHLRHLGCPVLGDPLYGRRDRRFPNATLMLHALRLAITLPGEDRPRTFAAPLPERFRDAWHSIIALGKRSTD